MLPSSATAPVTEPIAAQGDVPSEPVGWGWRSGLLLLWAVAGFGTLLLAEPLSILRLGSWPLHYWLAAQGVMLLYVAIAVFYAWLANRRERLARRDPAAPNSSR